MITQIPYTEKQRTRVEYLMKGEDLSLSGLANYLSFGMVSAHTSGSTYKYKCLACEALFVDSDDSTTHPCSREAEFRAITHRHETLAMERIKAGELTTKAGGTKRKRGRKPKGTKIVTSPEVEKPAVTTAEEAVAEGKYLVGDDELDEAAEIQSPPVIDINLNRYFRDMLEYNDWAKIEIESLESEVKRLTKQLSDSEEQATNLYRQTQAQNTFRIINEQAQPYSKIR